MEQLIGFDAFLDTTIGDPVDFIENPLPDQDALPFSDSRSLRLLLESLTGVTGVTASATANEIKFDFHQETVVDTNVPLDMQIASAIDVVIQLSRLSDGRRKLVSLQEITGMEGEIVTMQEIFTFERLGIDADGNVLGDIVPTGVRPKFAEKLKLSGFPLAADLFDRKTQ